MNVNLDLDDHLVKNIIDESLRSSQSFNEYIALALADHMSSRMSDEKIMSIAIAKVEGLQDGDKFTLKDLIGDMWDSIESPKAFGREFKKKAAHVARHTGVTSSNKACYEKYTYEGADYLMKQMY